MITNTAKFWNKWAEKYSKTAIKDPDAYRAKLRHTQRYLNTNMDILEIACGTGLTATIHSPLVNSIKAIDISENMISIAKQRAQKAGIANIEFETATLETTVHHHENYDAILGLSILHLLDDWKLALTKIHNLLEPGGFFVSSTPCMKHMTWLKILAPIGQFAGLMPVLSFFSKDELLTSFKATGFEIEHCWQASEKSAVFIIAKKRD